jgi:signal peptidase II
LQQRASFPLVLLGAVLLLLIDQVSKSLALRFLGTGGVRLLGGLVLLRIERNTGGAFGLLSGFPVLLAAVGLGVVISLLVMAGGVRGPLAHAGVALLLGGALGNLSDRVFRGPLPFRGAVVDFIDLRFWPVFNLADVAILLGAGLLALAAAREGRGEGGKEQRAGGGGHRGGGG